MEWILILVVGVLLVYGFGWWVVVGLAAGITLYTGELVRSPTLLVMLFLFGVIATQTEKRVKK
jgi:hypothetical protein